LGKNHGRRKNRGTRKFGSTLRQLTGEGGWTACLSTGICLPLTFIAPLASLLAYPVISSLSHCRCVAMEEGSTLAEALYVSKAPEVESDSEPLVGSSSTGKYFLFVIPMDWIYIPDSGGLHKPSNGPNESVFLLLNTMVGAGVLFQAYVFMKSGILWTTIEYIFVGFFSWLSIKLLIEMSEIHDIYDYTLLCDKVFGKRGRQAADAGIVFAQGGSLITYVIIIGTLLAEVIKNCDPWYCNDSFLAVLSITVVAVPLCLIRDLGNLVVASVVSVLVISSVFFLVIIGGPMESNSGSGSYHAAAPYEGVKNVGTVVFALGYVLSMYFVYNSMEVRNKEVYTVVTAKASAIGTVLCYTVGLVGYLCFKNDTEELILQVLSIHGLVITHYTW
jgi:hypothetical protein